MSHTTAITTANITDERAIASAVIELNQKGIPCRLEHHKVPRMYSNPTGSASHTGRNQLTEHGIPGFVYRKLEADMVLVLEKSKYDVALLQTPDGKFVPVLDSFTNAVGSQIGANRPGIPQGGMTATPGDIGLFLQLYQKHALMNEAEAQGLVVEHCEFDENGNLQFEAVSHSY